MLINRRFNETTEVDEILEASGLLEVKRYIILFTDQTLPRTRQTMGRAIQINLSTSKAESLVYEKVNQRANTTVTKMVVFAYNAVLPLGSDNPAEGEFILMNGISTAKESNHSSNQCFRSDLLTYDRSLATRDFPDDFKDYSGGIGFMTDPRYYSIQHQHALTFDFDDIRHTMISLSYTGEELIDKFTEIQLADIKVFESTYNQLKGIENFSDDKYNPNTSEMNNLQLYYPTVDTMIQKAIFSYDTNLGIKLEGGIVPHQKYIIQDSVKQDISNIFFEMKTAAKLIEQEHGAISMYLWPNATGNKMKIHYNDYKDDHQPFKNDSSSDSGSLVASQIAEDINDYTYQYGET